MAPPSFKDIAKSADDIINNDYNFSKKFKMKTKSANGVTFTVDSSMGKSVSGKVTTKFNPFDGISVSKLGVKTCGRVFLEASLNNAYEGAEFKVEAEDGAGKAPSGKLSMNYATSSLNFDASVDVVNGPTIATSGTFAYEGFVLGGEVKYNTEFDDGSSSSKVEDMNAALSYSGDDFTATLGTSKKMSQYDLSYHHNVSSSTKVATQFSFSGKGSKSLSVGGIHTVDSETKVQGKFDSNGLVSANWIQTVRPQVQVIASAQVNAQDFAGDSHKFGLSLILG